jgi:NAD(P)-dependent dehydrogenase (short-subunit alcohol dehydrogenase family)
MTKKTKKVRKPAKPPKRSRKIDVLVANAGTGEFAPLASLTEEHFDKLFDLNVKGTLFTDADERRRINHSHRLRRERQRHACLRHLRRDQGGCSQYAANLDHGAEGPAHSLQRPKPGSDQDATGGSTATGSGPTFVAKTNAHEACPQ